MRLFRILVCATCIASVLAPTRVYALPYGLIGIPRDGAGNARVTQGTYAKHYIYSKSQVHLASNSQGHVNSIYHEGPAYQFIEVGWVWKPSMSTAPRIFYNWENPVTGQAGGSYLNYTPTVGTWLRLKVERSTLDTWNLKIEEQNYQTLAYTGIWEGFAQNGTERDIRPTDDDRASWTYITYKDYYDSNWYYWSNVISFTNDTPPYHMYVNHLGDANHWIYVDDHQN